MRADQEGSEQICSPERGRGVGLEAGKWGSESRSVLLRREEPGVPLVLASSAFFGMRFRFIYIFVLIMNRILSDGGVLE